MFGSISYMASIFIALFLSKETQTGYILIRQQYYTLLSHSSLSLALPAIHQLPAVTLIFLLFISRASRRPQHIIFLVMYIFTPTVSLALHTVCFLALGDFSSVLNSATAAPIPLPLPLMAADRSLSLISVNRTISPIAGRNLLSRPYIRTIKPSRHMKEHARRAATSAELQTHYDRAKANSVKLSKRAVNI